MAIVSDIAFNAQLQTIRTEIANSGNTKVRVSTAFQDLFDTLNDRVAAKEDKTLYYAYNFYDLNSTWSSGTHVLLVEEWANYPDGYIDYQGIAIIKSARIPSTDGDFPSKVLLQMTLEDGNVFTRVRLSNGTWQDWIEVGFDKQPLDSDLTAIAALSADNDDFIQRKAGAWTNRTVAQVKTDLAIASDIAASLVTANAYADGLVVGLWDDRGNWDNSVNVYPNSGGSGTAGAIKKGDIWTCDGYGELAGRDTKPGDTIRALIDTPGTLDANWSIQQNNIGYVAENATNKNATGGYVGLSGFAIQFKNAANTFTSLISNTNTAIRNYIFPDKNITVAGIEDIQGAAAINATASGTDTYTATIVPTITALTAGMEFTIQFTNANTGASTLNLNALGAIALVKSGATALVTGDISANQRLKVNYDGTNFQIIGGGGGGGSFLTNAQKLTLKEIQIRLTN